MGTRADFYVGRGKDMEWLGSIAWDGYPDGIEAVILKADNENSFREAVATFIVLRDDGTTPDMGWPWPWKNSATTDCAYAFDLVTNSVWLSRFGSAWNKPREDENMGDCAEGDMPSFPNMDISTRTLGERSGLLVFRI